MEKLYKNSIKNYPKFDLQFDKNSFELTLNKVYEIKDKGSLDFSDNERKIPDLKEIKPSKPQKNDKYGWWKLPKGIYKISFNESLNLSKKTSGKIYSRKSLLHSGAFVPEIYIDEGYKGEISGLLIVKNPKGINLKENCRICKIVLNKKVF